jgi:hypothetical protein
MPSPPAEDGGETPQELIPGEGVTAAPVPASPIRTKVFISYSHNDEEWVARSLVHLKRLERLKLTEVWSDHRLKSGTLWRDEIETALRVTKVAIVYLSADFFASEFINSVELPSLLQAAENDGTCIIPVFVRPCPEHFARTSELVRYQALNPPTRPVSTMDDNEREFLWSRLFGEVMEHLQTPANRATGKSLG